jgi:hypothetical protein
MSNAPGAVRDSILSFLSALEGDATLSEISNAVQLQLGQVASSSIRSYLNANVPELFERTARGRYRVRSNEAEKILHVRLDPAV